MANIFTVSEIKVNGVKMNLHAPGAQETGALVQGPPSGTRLLEHSLLTIFRVCFLHLFLSSGTQINHSNEGEFDL